MKTKKTKFTSIAVAMAVAATPVLANEIYNATKNGFKVLVNNSEADIEGYNIDGYTYFKLRDIGKEVGFEVDFKDDTILINTEAEKETDTVKEVKK